MNEIGNSSRTNSGQNVLRCLGALAIIAQSLVVPLRVNAQNRAMDPAVGQESFFTVSVKLDSDLVEYPTPVTGTASVSWPDGTIFVGADINATATQALPDFLTGSTAGSLPTALPMSFHSWGMVGFSFSPSGPADVNVRAYSWAAIGADATAHATSITVVRNIIPVDNFKDRSQTRWGVCENINLSVTTLPTGHEVEMGTSQWDASGAQTKVLDIANGSFSAPEIADTVTVKLSVTDGKFKGKSWSTDRQVVTPDGVVARLERTANQVPVHFHRQNTMSAGFCAGVWLSPADVSFSKIVEAEQISPDVYCKTTGFLTYCDGKVKHVGHGWVEVGSGDAVNGCMLGIDAVRIILTEQPNGQTATLSASIPTWYRSAKSNGNGYLFHDGYIQFCTFDGAGLSTISKQGNSCWFAYNDPDCLTNNLFP